MTIKVLNNIVAKQQCKYWRTRNDLQERNEGTLKAPERERERERAVPGTIEDVVKDMFDGSPLYLVRTARKVLAVKEDSIISKP